MKRALLIGIDRYETGDARKNSLGEKIDYGNLQGCYNDILAIEAYLREIGAEKVIKLL